MTKVMLVDDEPSLVEFLEQLSGDAGYHAATAADGVTTVAAFAWLCARR